MQRGRGKGPGGHKSFGQVWKSGMPVGGKDIAGGMCSDLKGHLRLNNREGTSENSVELRSAAIKAT